MKKNISFFALLLLIFFSVSAGQDFFDAALGIKEEKENDDSFYRILQINQTLKDLQIHYLQHPSDSVLLKIAVVDRALKNNWRTEQLLNMLETRNERLSEMILDEYQRNFLGGKFILATATREILEEHYPNMIAEFFPPPELKVIFPDSGFSTMEDSVSIKFEVKHIYPLDTIRVDTTTIYYFDSHRENYLPGQGERKTFIASVHLHGGYNKIILNASGIYGGSVSDTLTVVNLRFGRDPAWYSAYSDSLKKINRSLREHLPSYAYIIAPAYKFRMMLLSGRKEKKNAEFDLFMYDWLTDSIWGSADSSRSTILPYDRFNEPHVTPTIEEWLLRRTYDWSRTILYFSGNWQVDSRGWFLNGEDGYKLDVLKLLKRLLDKNSAAVVTFIEGWSADDSLGYSMAGEMTWNSSTPLAFVFVNGEKTLGDIWKKDFFLPVDSLTDGINKTLEITPENIRDYVAVDTLLCRPENLNIRLGFNPVRRLRVTAGSMWKELSAKLKSMKIPREEEKSVTEFLRDWRNYRLSEKILKGEIDYSQLKKILENSDTKKRKEGGINE